jgi:hypothetical protein
MKNVIFGIILLAGTAAHAKIDVYAYQSYAESTGSKEATVLTDALKTAGVKGYPDSMGTYKLNVKGNITQLNGAACDDGRLTYRVEMTEVDAAGKDGAKITLDGTSECKKVSDAEKFNQLLNQWGGKILYQDCGAGHCWTKISSIECTHFPADKTTKAFDSCSVILGEGQ